MRCKDMRAGIQFIAANDRQNNRLPTINRVNTVTRRQFHAAVIWDKALGLRKLNGSHHGVALCLGAAEEIFITLRRVCHTAAFLFADPVISVFRGVKQLFP